MLDPESSLLPSCVKAASRLAAILLSPVASIVEDEATEDDDDVADVDWSSAPSWLDDDSFCNICSRWRWELLADTDKDI